MISRRLPVLTMLAIACLTPARARAAGPLRGTVTDQVDAVVASAEVTLLTPDRTVVAATRTDGQGRFVLDEVRPGRYLLVVRAPSLRDARRPVTVAPDEAAPDIRVQLAVGGFSDDVTVTASRDSIEEVRSAGQPVNVVDDATIFERVNTVAAQAVRGEAGVALQQTSPTMAGVFVRGLTGNKVNVFVDGVRYSNGAQRGGVNTFLDLIEPSTLDGIEVLRGPSSAQYGSDALGGSVQFLTKIPSLGVSGGPRWGGAVTIEEGSAHRHVGGSGLVSYTGRSLGLTGQVAGRTVGSIRAGDGIDSHAAVTRFFGLRSDRLMEARLPDTSFWQATGFVRTNWTLSPSTQVHASYIRTFQDGGKRYDQLLGGDGNLIADLNDLSLDLLIVRFERLAAGPFQHLSLTYSLNSQREERINQGGNGNPNATIGHEPERTTVNGVQGAVTSRLWARQSLTIGGDLYLEGLTSDAFNVNPVTGAVTPRRPRVPSGARFHQGGVYAQTAVDVRPDRVRLLGALRAGGAHYRASASDSPLVNGRPLWPDDSLGVFDVTFRAAVVATPDDRWTFSAAVARGFRAPHMTDLGTLGLTGSGFEVAAPDVSGLGATVGTTADATAVSTGDAVEQVSPETILDYEGTVAFRNRRFRTDLTVFVNNVHDNMQKQSLILPPGAAGTSIGGQPIIAQTAGGAVFVAASTNPVLVRANFDNARIWGVEHSAQLALGASAMLRSTFTYLRAKDTETGLPPNIEGGTPAPSASLSLHLARPGRPWWIAPYLYGAWRQSHLSSLDLGDRRIGASRSRASIRSFFLNGARARGWTGPGPDGAFGTADDVLLVTGETLAQVQDRVLGVGVNSSSLFTAVPGYATIGVRAGWRHRSHELIVDAENLTDRNYRDISWGVDGPGVGLTVRYRTSF
jgi:hemoglobin/transferrin/lactoferrin receptor protein